jgi:chromosome partitioning related protein ParA
MTKTIGVVSTKGGVGKTSVTAALGATLADMGQRVLLVDGDFQQSLSRFYTLEFEADSGTFELISKINPEGCISRTSIDHLDIVLSNDTDQRLLYKLKESTRNVYFLKAALHKIKNNYDFILIDSQGSKSILQESIILASDLLVSPIVPEALDSQEFMRGTLEMLKSLEPPEGLAIPSPPIPPLYGLIYKQDRTDDSIRIANTIRKAFYAKSDGKISILDTFVPKLSSYAKAAARHIPVHRLETLRRGPTRSALEIYTGLVHELFPHLSDISPQFSESDDRLEA